MPTRDSRQGKLKFTLHGEKLHGSWALVRMGGRAGDGGKNWLLIKHRDDGGQAGRQVRYPQARATERVCPDRELDEIASRRRRHLQTTANRGGPNRTPSYKSSENRKTSIARRPAGKGLSQLEGARPDYISEATFSRNLRRWRAVFPTATAGCMS